MFYDLALRVVDLCSARLSSAFALTVCIACDITAMFELYSYIASSKYRMAYLLSPCDSRCMLTSISDSDLENEATFQEPGQGDASGEAWCFI